MDDKIHNLRRKLEQAAKNSLLLQEEALQQLLTAIPNLSEDQCRELLQIFEGEGAGIKQAINDGHEFIESKEIADVEDRLNDSIDETDATHVLHKIEDL